MPNLRDRGFSSSMDGYQPKKTERPRSRKKTVASGTASVGKGTQATKNPVRDSGVVKLPSVEQIRSTPSYGSVPEYSPTYPTGLSPTQSQPLDFQFTNPEDARQPQYANQRADDDRWELTPSETESGLTTAELKKRIKALEDAMAAIDRTNSNFLLRKFGNKEHSGQAYADYNWNYHDWLDDTLPDLTNDPVALISEQMEHAKAAATGRALRNQAGTTTDGSQYENLFNEYNNLKNEYNVRLAQYLQGLR